MSRQGSTVAVGTSVDLAVRHLRQGGIVAFPTETYYGLAVDADCDSAVTRLFSVKKRQADKPLLLLIERTEQLEPLVREIPKAYLPLMKKYWPGPLTLVFQAKKHINTLLTGNTGTVGLRISPHPIAEQLVRRMGKPITATSANLSGLPPARSAREVIKMLGNGIDYILDGGQTAAGMCSTILGLERGRISLLRPGQIDVSDIIRGNDN